MARFNIVFDMGKPLYANETKIIIEKAVLTKDNETGKVFAQIKMKNVLAKTLIAVKVTLTGYDVSGEKIEEEEFTYLDIAVNQGREFGQKTPVEFQNSTVRSFNVKITETVYFDGSKLTGTEAEYYPLPEPELLSSKLSRTEIEQYKKSNEISSADYIVTEFYDLWICTCGVTNTIDNDTCYSCGASRENLKRTLDKDLLDDEINVHIYDEAIKAYRPEDKTCIERAIKTLKAIEGYKDSKELIVRYEAEIAAIDRKAADEARARKKKATKITDIFAGIVALCVAVALLFNFVIMPIVRANKLRAGNFEVGDTVVLGDYHGANEWIVLDKQEDKALLISKYCLDAKPYNEKYEPVTWETCTLRQWLNGDFINETFSGAEKAIICDTYLQNTDNPKYGTNGGNDTTDKVFLLSINEVTRYFANDGDRKATATDYAKEQGIYVLMENGNSLWWLRSPGDNDKSAACVQSVGFVSYRGSACTASMRGVRPAMWVNLQS